VKLAFTRTSCDDPASRYALCTLTRTDVDLQALYEKRYAGERSST
jgi:hypothetical protein